MEPACRSHQDQAAAWSREQAGLVSEGWKSVGRRRFSGWSGLALSRALHSGASLSFLAAYGPDGAGSAALAPGSPAAS